LLVNVGDKEFQRPAGNGGDACDDALVVFAGESVETFEGYALGSDVSLFEGVEKFFGQFALQVALYPNLVDLFVGVECFDNGADAEEQFVIVHCAGSWSSSRALAMAACVREAPLSIRAISLMRSAGVSLRSCVRVRFGWSCL